MLNHPNNKYLPYKIKSIKNQLKILINRNSWIRIKVLIVWLVIQIILLYLGIVWLSLVLRKLRNLYNINLLFSSISLILTMISLTIRVIHLIIHFRTNNLIILIIILNQCNFIILLKFKWSRISLLLAIGDHFIQILLYLLNYLSLKKK